MANTNVLCTDGRVRQVLCQSLKCPGCGSLVVPELLCYDEVNGGVFCRCPVDTCGSYFLMIYRNSWWSTIPNHPLKRELFGEIISATSPRFVKIFNESYVAEQMSLMDVCGVGYRKALEFLIKDYVIEGKEEDIVEKIKAAKLARCVEEYVTDINIKNVAKRAIWLGNDETHYVRKWEEKDVQDLKGLIRLTIRWIEQEKETAALLLEMPEEP